MDLKRRISLLLCAMLLLVTLPLAGNGQDDVAETRKAEFNETGYPITDEEYTMTFLYSRAQGHADPAERELVFYKRLRELTNIKIDWVIVPGAVRKEKINIMLASGDYPEGMLGFSLDSDQVAELGKQGIALRWNDLIDKYMPNFQKVIEQRPLVLNSIADLDGDIYHLPYVNEYSQETNGLPHSYVVNKSFLDNLNLEIPSTKEELVNVLRAIKENDANGNGDPDDEIPFSFIWNNWARSLEPFFGMFGINYSKNRHIMLEDDKVIYYPATEDFRTAIKWINSLYTQGLLDVEGFTQDWNTYIAKHQENIMGFVIDWTLESMDGGNPELAAALQFIPPIIGSDKTIWPKQYYSGIGTPRFVMTDKVKSPEIMARFIDTFYEPDWSMQVCYGPYDINLKRTPTSITYIEPPKGMTLDDYRGTETTMFAPYAILRPGLADIFPYDRYAQQKVDANKEYYKSLVPPQIMPPLRMSKEDKQEEAILRTDLTRFVNEKTSRWILNEANIDDEWNDFLATLNNMQMNRYLELNQKYYEANWMQ